MNPAITRTETNIKIYEAHLIKLGNDLGRATDNGHEVVIELINNEIRATQQWLKEEMELLDSLKQAK
jgi:hypothetical protein